MPIPLIVVGAILLLLLALLLLRIKLCITYREDVALTARALGIRVRLFPRRKKIKWRRYSPKKAKKISDKKEKKQLTKLAKKEKKKARRKAKPKLPFRQRLQTINDKVRFVRVLLAAVIRKTHRHLRLQTARLHIRVASDDAAKTAILYGAVCQSVAYLLAALDSVTKLKSTTTQVSVEPDFLSERSSADVKIVLSVRVFGALMILFGAAFAYVRLKFERKNHSHKQNEKAAQKGGERPVGAERNPSWQKKTRCKK